MLWCASMVNASEIKRSLVALDESQDLLVEVESGVPDQGPIPEYPQHHPADVRFFPWPEEGHRRECRGWGRRRGREEQDGDLTLLLPRPRLLSSAGGLLPGTDGRIGVSGRRGGGEDGGGGGGALIPREEGRG